MNLGNGPDSRAIANSLAARAHEAFGRSAKGEVGVTAVETHIADVNYNVRVEYSTKVESRYHPGAIGEWNSREAVDQALVARHHALMVTPGKTFGEWVYRHLKSNSGAITHSGSFKAVQDSETYSFVDTCFNCAGYGEENCHHCSGRGRSTCSTCYGHRKVTCRACLNGYVGGPPVCTYCSGAGVYVGSRCTGCSGTGRMGSPCGYCHTALMVTCGTCDGSGDELCTSCDRGKVVCGICDGACRLTHTSCLDVMVQTSINYSWSGASPWMSAALKKAMNDKDIFPTVFNVKTIQRDDQDDVLFIGKGEAIGSSANVTYRGRSAVCHFIGTGATPVDLGGVLSGNFDAVLSLLDNPKRLGKARKGSKGPIASTLIDEIEWGGQAAITTTPVRTGIVTAHQAIAFTERREETQKYLNGRLGKLSIRPVLRHSVTVFILLMLFYFLASIMGNPGQRPVHGILALLIQPKAVFESFIRPYDFAFNYGGWTLWTFLVASFAFGTKVVTKIWDKAGYWPSTPILRSLFLTASGSFGLALLLALTPTLEFVFYPPAWLPSGQHFRHGLAATLALIPQVYATALLYSLVRFKTASKFWVDLQKRHLRMI